MNLKRITCFGDYVAILQTLDLPEGIELPNELEKQKVQSMSNEGVIVGKGPDASEILVGRKVIFAPKRESYAALQPKSGGYAESVVLIMKKGDLMVDLGPSTNYIIDEGA